MKAVVLHQPYATLVALGVKTIETRPGPPNGPMRPDGVRGLPGLAIEPGERIAIVAGTKRPKWGATFGADFTIDMWAGRTGFCLSCTDEGWDLVDLPLGAVACTAVVAEALPMEPCPPYSTSFDDRWEPPAGGMLYLGGLDGGPWGFGGGGLGPFPLMDQRPYGDFAPGRWGWLLTDVEPCAPVPVKGKQGVFLLPDDVAEQVNR